MRVAKQKKYEDYADVNKEYVLLNWLPADFFATVDARNGKGGEE